MVFTFTTRGTIEEKIERKLLSKRELAEWVVQPDELMRKEVTREELQQLVELDE